MVHPTRSTIPERLSPNATDTPRPTSPAFRAAQSISAYTKHSTTKSHSTTLPSRNVTTENQHGPDNGQRHVPSSLAPRPPVSRLSLDPRGLHLTTNGVVTEVELCSQDVATVSSTSASRFDHEITKETTPPPGDKDKRVLRSQGVSLRLKSNLARFFPDFEDVVYGAEAEPDTLTADSTLFIFEDKSSAHSPQSRGPLRSTSPEQRSFASGFRLEHDVDSYGALLDAREARAERSTIDLTAFEEQAEAYTVDPLPDSTYVQAHKRGERKEKQIRNIEKEHALHEKSDLERLLEDLKGPDWLKAMGIGAVTEMERRKYEPHRNNYIQRMKALLDRFSAWKEQERQLKLRRDEALLAREEAENEEGADSDVEHDLPDARSHSQSSDLVDASARQLQLEAKSAFVTLPRARIRYSTKTYLPIPDPEPDTPFTSFYDKAHLRTAALSGHRRGRTSMAFGQAVPDVSQQEFSLPDDYVTEETVIANARKRRRMKRETIANTANSKN